MKYIAQLDIRRKARNVGGDLRSICRNGIHPMRIADSAYTFAGFRGARYWRREFARLLKILSAEPPRCVLEIGVGWGASIYCWARVATKDALFVGVDGSGINTVSGAAGFPLAESRQRLYSSGAVRASQDLRMIFGDSHSQKTKDGVLEALAGRPVDFLFIDGDHTYDGVWQDYRDYAPLVRSGGLIAFHDIHEDFKTRYGTDTGVDSGQVPKFWEELTAERRGISIVDNPDQDGCGVGIVRE